MVITAIYVPLLQSHGLTMSEVMQTQTLFALVVALGEVPSGYLADLWGRKNTIVAGAALCALGFALLTLANSYLDFMIYEFVLGIGICLISGADLALLYDSQNELNRRGYPGSNSRHIARLYSIEGFSGAIAAVLTGILVLWSLQLVLVVQALISLAPLVIAATLTEVPREISVGSHRSNAVRVKDAIVKQPMILSVTLATIIFSLAAMYVFWLYQKYWELQGIPLAYFGYIWAAHCIIRGVAARYASTVEIWLGSRRLLVGLAVLNVAGLVGMALVSGWFGVGLAFLLPVVRGMTSVILADALNRRIKAEFRATVNSLVSLGFRSAFIVTGPLLGILVDSQGVNTTLLVLAVLFVPLFIFALIFLFASIKIERNAELAKANKANLATS